MMNMHINQVHDCCKGSQLKEEALQPVKSHLKKISKQLKISTMEAALLSVIVREASENSLSMKDLASFLGLEDPAIKGQLFIIRKLTKAGFIRVKGRRTRRRDTNFLQFEIRLAPELLTALEREDLSLLKPQPIRTLGKFMDAWDQLVAMRKEKIISFTEFIYRTAKLSVQGRTIDLIRLLDKLDICGFERAFVLSVSRDFCQGANAFDGTAYIREITQDEPDLRLECFSYLSQDTSRLVKLNLLTIEPEDFMTEGDQVVPGGALITVLPEFVHRKKKASNNLYRVIRPTDIRQVDMCYDDELGQAVGKLASVLGPDAFNRLRGRMSERKMRNGLTIMLHGSSGTGKTETVLQVARTSMRPIMVVDGAQIQNAYVGVAEKNVRALFAEYRRLYQCEAVTPILLFNEADGLIQKRRPITTGLDAHDNALQNILLEELEVFEGIFIGTTNLLTNMDPAFERRFLFRLEFKCPLPATRAKLLHSRFPTMNPEVIQRISTKFTLTGSQIENARRKIDIEEVLDPGFELTSEVLEKHLNVEGKIERMVHLARPIGFRFKSAEVVAV